MPEHADPSGTFPQVYSIAAHRGFADALVAGLLPRYRQGEFGLARLTLLLPSQRAMRTLTEAFVRISGGGLLLPRMAVVGDLDLDETLGPLFDTVGSGGDIPAAADATRRWLRLADLLVMVAGADAPRGAALLRRAFEIGRTMDRLLVEGIAPEALLSENVVGLVGNQSAHWISSTREFAAVQLHWLAELDARGEVDAAARRNMLFDRAARNWLENPPEQAIVAAGITSASPSLARLLRAVSLLPAGSVILPDLDREMDDDVWAALGIAGAPTAAGDPPFGRHDASTHPQYHLKLLLNRMGVARGEVQPWHRAGIAAAPPARSRAISSLFLPPEASARWVDLPAERRRLSGVRLMETAHPGEEAQAIAILIRQALEVPERRIALITPDRGLAARVVGHLQRWGIVADDTAGLPLPQTAAGRVLLLLAEVLAQGAAPVPLLALVQHPLVRAGEGRAAWLEQVRAFDLLLRGPRKGPGLEPLRSAVAVHDNATLALWWAEVEAALAPLLALSGEVSLAAMFDSLATTAEALCGSALWANADGRMLAGFVEELRSVAADTGTRLEPAELPAVLRDAMDRISVRPPWGSHPRIGIYGLIEARMSRADLVICGALHEGSWPASPVADALLAPPVLRALGVPGADFRIGLSAHDLAAALGAPEVVLSHARRDSSGPVIPSRFILRIKAMLGEISDQHEETEAVKLAREVDRAPRARAYPRPRPMPDAAQRLVDVSVTGLDRLRGDPYQFYAGSILRLKKLDAIDAQPSAAWKGIAVHAILEAWHKAGGMAGELSATAGQVLDAMDTHPLMRGLWWPRLLAALQWIDAEVAHLKTSDGRAVLKSEVWGDMRFKDVRIHGRADRIDRVAGGSLAIVDYKTGKAPSNRMVKDGFALQLGLIGLIARGGGFKDISGEPTVFEYWSLNKDDTSATGFGKRKEPFKTGRSDGVVREEFLDATSAYLADAIDCWILGSEAFTARLNPDLRDYNDYDHLMRLDEWLPQLTRDEADGS